MSYPWIEKYRPSQLEDIVGNQYAIQQLIKLSNQGNIPHMMFCGRPGVGKTTSIICLAKILLGEHFSQAFIELNASDERKIDVIRDKVKVFCNKMVVLPENRHKIIFLDEADSMTMTSQQALRRIMEQHTKSTRFILACNSSNQIIEAIQSRCVIVRFSKINNDDMYSCLKDICEKEEIEYSEEGLKELVFHSTGDMRRSINDMEAIYNTFGKIDENIVETMMNKPKYSTVEKLVKCCDKGDFKGAKELCDELIYAAHLPLDILDMIFKILMKDSKINDKKKIKYLKNLGKIQMNMIRGADPHLQLLSLISRFIMVN